MANEACLICFESKPIPYSFVFECGCKMMIHAACNNKWRQISEGKCPICREEFEITYINNHVHRTKKRYVKPPPVEPVTEFDIDEVSLEDFSDEDVVPAPIVPNNEMGLQQIVFAIYMTLYVWWLVITFVLT
jgi:hypothetical protein